MKYMLVCLLLFFSSGDIKDIAKINSLKKQAQDAYLSKNYTLALESYKALIEDYKIEDENIIINLANAYYEVKDTLNAHNNYVKLAVANNKHIRSQALTQLGVITRQKQNLKESLAFFKDALKADPSNEVARYNYELIKKMIANQQNQEQQSQQNGKSDMEPSEFAKKLKEEAEKLVFERKYKDAFDMMIKGLQRDETVAYYNDFIGRLGDVVEINE